LTFGQALALLDAGAPKSSPAVVDFFAEYHPADNDPTNVRFATVIASAAVIERQALNQRVLVDGISGKQVVELGDASTRVPTLSTRVRGRMTRNFWQIAEYKPGCGSLTARSHDMPPRGNRER
jgi:hypothetical protein